MLHTRSLASLLAAPLLSLASAAGAAECSARSGDTRALVVELYTSEGCDSCPAADRWLSGLKALSAERSRPLVPLAFHVDYWDGYGWRDRFSSPQFTQRQKQRGAFSGAGFLYTPQVLLDSRDFKAWSSLGDPSPAARKSEPRPGASIALRNEAQPGGRHRVTLSARLANPAARGDAVAWLALVENQLLSEVRAGENAGKRLQHDYVVREWIGPLAFDVDGRLETEREFRRPESVAANTGITAVVESTANGQILQALALQSCREEASAR
jgi:hypothetical protein